jgi:hypothetical protein
VPSELDLGSVLLAVHCPTRSRSLKGGFGVATRSAAPTHGRASAHQGFGSYEKDGETRSLCRAFGGQRLEVKLLPRLPIFGRFASVLWLAWWRGDGDGDCWRPADPSRRVPHG